MSESELKILQEKEKQYFFSTYKRLDVLIDRGEGCWLISNSDEKILDMFGGLAVNVLGYNHPKINEAIESQIHKYIHISNFFLQEPQIELAEKLIGLTGFSKIFFSNSGTESVEGSLKIVRQFFRNTGKSNLISFTGSYHGRSYGSLSLTHRPKYREGFEPMLPGIRHLKFNFVDDLENNIDDTIAAVYLECIQGEGGLNMISSEFAEKLKGLHQEYQFLLVIDEIQSGVGRTGKLHAYEHFDLNPDIVVIAKGMGGGLPLGAVLGNDRVANVFGTGMHGSTFGGNPVSAACGNVVYNELAGGLLDEVRKKGDYLKGRLEELKLTYPASISAIKGLGLMLGVELNIEGQQVVDRMLEQNVLVNCTNLNVIRLLPPYVITEKEMDLFIEKFDYVLSKF